MITNWRKSSRSTSNGTCVEVGGERIEHVPAVQVRDTKNRSYGTIQASGGAWMQFVRFATRD